MTRQELAENLILKAGEMLLKGFGNIDPSTITDKDSQSFVTEVDTAIEKMYRKEIKELFPDDSMLGEEYGYEEGSSDFTWIFDPLDGTNNFTRGIPLSGNMIAIQEKKITTSGYIYLPYEKELYYAHKGEGAFCRRVDTGEVKMIHVSDRDMENYMIVTDPWQEHDLYLEEQPLFTALHEKIKNLRSIYCAAYFYSMVASGKAELIFNPRANPWDVVAGCLLIEEAGGTVTNYRGEPVTDYTKSIVATNGVAHDEILKIIKATYKTTHFEL